ncbi:MAG: TonB-dependent receptor [Burkholderiales bacterium]|nr:TonB-dependent receptor [Burkholderiales bacterium]
MHKRTSIGAAVLIALGATATLPVLAQSTQRVEVTGSNIKRIDAETVSPVTVITREQIERTGQPTAAEVLRNLPGNGGGSFGESFSNSFAPGAAGISLRSLGEKATLVLLNGRRVAGYGFAQNLQDSFVDLNSIPSSAIDRIEILRDGASAIYGSDAIAGVVNIILRKDFKGFEASLSGGSFEGKKDYRFTLAGGIGEPGKDKYNVFAALDYYKRDLLKQGDTEFIGSRDFRSHAGGRNFQSLTGGGTWQQITGTSVAGTASNTFKANSDCNKNGFVIDGVQAAQLGLIDLSPVPVQSAATLATNTARAVATNTFCAHDFKDQFTALPGTERLGLLTRGTYDFSASTQGYAELGWSRVDTTQTFQSPFFAGTTGLQSTAAGLRPFTYNINFDPGVAGNPFTTRARYVGVFNDMGTRNNEIRSDTVRGVVGVSYALSNWDMDSGLGYSKNDVQSMNLNRTTLSGTSAVFGVGTAPQPPIPASKSATYNLDHWTSNSDAVRDSMRINFPRKSTSELTFIDTKASTSIGAMPGGQMGLALGIEHREEKLKDVPDINAQNGNVLGQGITATDGKRDNTALYTELSLPFTKAIEAQAALRYDRYSDYGTSTTPKIGAKWRINDAILVRANWGKGFHAPTLPEISPSVATFFTTVIDPEDGVSRQVSGVFAGNPSLKPETSISRNVGLVLEPMKNTNLELTWFQLDYRNVVATDSLQSIINNSCPAGGPACPSTASVVRDPTNNQVVTLLSNYKNLSQRLTSGFDANGSYKFNTGLGTFTVRGDVTYTKTFKENGIEYVGTNGGANTYPRIKGNLGLDFDRGPWSFTTRASYVHSVYQQLLAASFYTIHTPEFQNGPYPERVGSRTTVDLFGRYNVNKNITIAATVLNVFDKLPPYDPGFSSTSLYDFSLHDIRGRQYRLTLSYKM